jgi:hypothetical protein
MNFMGSVEKKKHLFRFSVDSKSIKQVRVTV